MPTSESKYTLLIRPTWGKKKTYQITCLPFGLSWWALVVSWLQTRALDLESQGSSPTSVRDFFLFPLCLTSMPWALLHQMRRCFTVSFGGDVKPSVPGDQARLASGYSRPSLASTIVVNPKGWMKQSAPRTFTKVMKPLVISGNSHGGLPGWHVDSGSIGGGGIEMEVHSPGSYGKSRFSIKSQSWSQLTPWIFWVFLSIL